MGYTKVGPWVNGGAPALSAANLDTVEEQYEGVLAGDGAWTGTGAGFRDEDDMASDDATAAASQQSIKAYVDLKSTKVWLAASVEVVTDLNRTALLNWADLDLTGDTSADAKFAILVLRLVIDSITAGSGNYAYLQMRKNGDTPDAMPVFRVDGTWAVAGTDVWGFALVGLDAGEVLEYQITIAGTIQLDTYIHLVGYFQ